MLECLALLARPVAPEPGVIVGPLAWIFGVIINFIFEGVYLIGIRGNSLGISIILLTIVFRVLTLPLNIRFQKSMQKMQQLTPEINKIKEKYGNSNDPEIKKKINQETTALWAEHKVNPLGGCLPMLLQMPLFFGLNFIMQQAFLYINRLQTLYHNLAQSIIDSSALSYIHGFAEDFLPNNIISNNNTLGELMLRDPNITVEAAKAAIPGDTIVLNLAPDLSRILNRFTTEHWDGLFNYIRTNAPTHYDGIFELAAQRAAIETFLGLPIVEGAGLGFPGILIPILVGLATFVSAWLGQQRTDGEKTTQQTVMLVVMPIFLAAITIGFPAGVGIFWITSNIFQITQQYVMNKKAGIAINIPFFNRR